jgi:predicted DNA-binding transcriptional regulator YafY
MKTFENIYKLHQLLRDARYPVSLERIRDTLGCSRSTAQRVIGYLRDLLGAPIETTTDPSGYRYTNEAFELPGLWFPAAQIQALLLLQQILECFQPGLLNDVLEPLRRRLQQILETQGLSATNSKRIRLLKMAARAPGAYFKIVATALLQRKRLSIRYAARSTGEVSQRDVSPQRLVLYRDNWYLDAVCHRQKGLRTFSVDCIENAELLTALSVDIDESALDRELGESYGLFSGPPTAIAMLRFTPMRARWVAPELWHPDQKSWYEQSGHYVREVPYGRPDELILDIMRYGPDVEVIAPLELRQAVGQRLREAAAQYAA